jgi:hypothetical protein
MIPAKTRRDFLATTACSGACLLASAVASGAQEGAKPGGRGEARDLDSLSYCCAECTPERCPFFKATLTDDREFKLKVAAGWQKKFGRSFSPEEVFCFGCKAPLEKRNHGVRACTVRACVVDKNLASCAHCRDLTTCQKELWINYPKLREKALEIQKQVLG